MLHDWLDDMQFLAWVFVVGTFVVGVIVGVGVTLVGQWLWSNVSLVIR